jgi:hypothetical protein
MTEGLDRLIEVTELGDDEIDGQLSFHYRGNEDLQARIAQQKARMLELEPSSPHYEQTKESIENAIRQYEGMQHQVDFWIGKDDYLLRQIRQQIDLSYTKYPGEDREAQEQSSTLVTYKFFDFNADITIEPPSEVEGVDLIANHMNTLGGGEDLEHEPAKYEITITNRGTKTARDVRVFVDSLLTNDGLQTFEAVPVDGAVTIGPGESTKYTASWEFDLAIMGKPKAFELVKQDVVRVTWTDEDGQAEEKVLTKGGLALGP